MKSYKFNDIFDCVDLPVFIHDKDFRLLYANQAYYAIAHTDESAAVGKVYWAVFPKQDVPPNACYEAILSKNGNSSRDEIAVGDRVYRSMTLQSRSASCSCCSLPLTHGPNGARQFRQRPDP